METGQAIAQDLNACSSPQRQGIGVMSRIMMAAVSRRLIALSMYYRMAATLHR